MKIQDLTDAGAVEKALAEFDERGGLAFRETYEVPMFARSYISHASRLYPAWAIAYAAYGYQHPPLIIGDDVDWDVDEALQALRRLDFTIVSSEPETVEEERRWRHLIWQDLVSRRNDAGLVTLDAIRSVRADGYFRGIWVDAARTKQLHPSGIAVGLKHIGQQYRDESNDDGVLYHYPVTGRPGRDLAGVNAAKAAAELKLPVFVINEVGDYRSVRLAWVEGWEDESHLFLIRFGEAPPERIINRDRSEEEPFSLEGNRSRKRRGSVTVRPDQARFKIEVFRRYGPHCPLSGIAVPEMIEAAHLRGDADGGSSDARNGLPMNAALHRAFDAHLFAINPDTMTAEVRPEGPTLDELGIVHPKLALPHLPHQDALAWRYAEWLRRIGHTA
ncbi:HNH endonuclease signature motif containing protein [Streptomyces sp. NPDC048564]|uniref:HNH endonuclease n=1 Tax=Streptomyces sp. NPDC048564 TaxID=3155760 RepID=UPI00341379AE